MMTGVALNAADIGDPDSTRTVIAIIALLVVLGLALVMLAFWLRRTTRPDPEFLAPLEVMGERSWLRGDPVWQRRRLDEVRPESAVPLKKAALPPRLDESFDAGPSGTGFDDLRSHDGTAPPAAVADEPVDATTALAEPDRAATADDAPGALHDETEHEADVEGDASPTVAADVAHEPGDRDDELDADGASPPDGSPDTVGGERDVDGDDDGDDLDDGGDLGDDVEDMRTPIGSPRPLLDDLPEHDIDPAVLEQAMAELDAELQRRGNDS